MLPFSLIYFVDLDVSLTGEIFGKELESLIGIGDLSVLKTGDCANFQMTVTFLSLPGDQPEMRVNIVAIFPVTLSRSCWCYVGATNRGESL